MKEKIVGWLRFVHSGTSKSGKTDTYDVEHKVTGLLIGHVMWSGRWRQYVYEADTSTFYSRGCLGDIVTFLDELMEKRK